MTRPVRLALIISALILPLTACSNTAPQKISETTSVYSLAGTVYGGQQPVVGAAIQIFAVGAGGTASAATPLLNRTIKTDTAGHFKIAFADINNCNGASQIYLTATGGNPGITTTNPNLSLMTAFGSCSSITTSTRIAINELTTVAAVSALAPFMASPSALGSTSVNVSGLNAAFKLAAQYADVNTGTTPGQDVPSGFMVPGALINTLANVMAACVNSTGGAAGDQTTCGRLFQLTTVNQSAPLDTLAAFLALFKNPTANNAAIYRLAAATPPFQPILAAAPTDFTISLQAVGDITVSSAQIIFPSTLLNTVATSEVITLSNTGAAVLPLSPPQLTGVNQIDFSIQNGCPATLYPNAPCQIAVRFQPTSLGSRQAILSIAASSQNPIAVMLMGSSVSIADLPTLSSALPVSVVAAYDLTQAAAGQPIQDVSANPAKAIPWPSSNAPVSTPQGLIFDGQTTSCLNLPVAVTGAVAVSIFNTKFGEDYVNAIRESYRRNHVLFAGTVLPGNIYSAEKFATGIVGGSFFHPQIITNDYVVETLESAVGSHLLTFAPSSSAGDSLGIDGAYVTSYLKDASTASSFQSPYFIGCEHPGSGIAEGTISYVILWSTRPTQEQLASTYKALKPIAQAHGINNDWLLPASGQDRDVACIGDSRTEGSGPGSYCSSVNMPLLGPPYVLHRMSTSAKFLSDMVPELPYELYKNIGANANKPITILDGGTNDMISESYASPDPFFAQFKAAAAAAHAAGTRFIHQTYFSLCIDNNYTAESSLRNTLNQWIRTNWTTYADGISDVAANPALGADNVSCGNTTLFDGSNVHLNYAGKAVEGPTPQSAILNLDGSTYSHPTLISASAGIAAGQNYILANCPIACTLTLPAVYLNAGWQFTVASQGPGPVTVAPQAHETINQQAGEFAVASGQQATFQSIASVNTATAGAAWTTH